MWFYMKELQWHPEDKLKKPREIRNGAEKSWNRTPQIFHWACLSYQKKILFENASFCEVGKEINFSR